MPRLSRTGRRGQLDARGLPRAYAFACIASALALLAATTIGIGDAQNLSLAVGVLVVWGTGVVLRLLTDRRLVSTFGDTS